MFNSTYTELANRNKFSHLQQWGYISFQTPIKILSTRDITSRPIAIPTFIQGSDILPKQLYTNFQTNRDKFPNVEHSLPDKSYAARASRYVCICPCGLSRLPLARDCDLGAHGRGVCTERARNVWSLFSALPFLWPPPPTRGSVSSSGRRWSLTTVAEQRDTRAPVDR